MIVRNEIHIIRETLDSVAPFITTWVIIDTGSEDGTQDVIREHMRQIGLPGELHERPWRDFGHNRTEALRLAQGHGDFIWVVDADDIVVGTPDFSCLTADVFLLRRIHGTTIYWRAELYRNGVHAQWVGVTHEYATWDDCYAVARLEGDYHVSDRQLSARNLSGEKFQRDRDLLLAEVERDPQDSRSVFYLAQSYFDLGDMANARKWYEHRVNMGGWDEETVYFSMLRLAESLAQLEEPWPRVQEAYLQAWEYRPTRAEALYLIAVHYRVTERFNLGYLFAQRAARIPIPESDNLFVQADIYSWRAADEQAVCAFWVGRQTEAFALNRSLLARVEVPEEIRGRLAINRDYSVPAMIDTARAYPDARIVSLAIGGRNTGVTVSMHTGPDVVATELALNSFINCCNDLSLADQFILFDHGMNAADRARVRERYPFVTITEPEADCRDRISGRLWLDIGQCWTFFAPEDLITRLSAVLTIEPAVFQVGVNFTDATGLIGACADEQIVRRSREAGRYVLAGAKVNGPAMVDLCKPVTANSQIATLDEVLCVVVQ